MGTIDFLIFLMSSKYCQLKHLMNLLAKNVIKIGRFCRRHRLRTGENVPSVPRDLLLMSEMVLPRFIINIIQYLRDGYTESGKHISHILAFPEPVSCDNYGIFFV